MLFQIFFLFDYSLTSYGRREKVHVPHVYVYNTIPLCIDL